MIFRESENIELKAIVVDDIKKEVIAFANCDGGKLYIGVQDISLKKGFVRKEYMCGRDILLYPQQTP